MPATDRLMHVVLTLSPGGGAEQLVYDMVRRSVSITPPVVCCLFKIGKLGEKLQEAGISVHCHSEMQHGFSFSIIQWLKEVIQSEGVKVVHAHQYTPMFYAVPAALLAGGVKVVYTEHGRLYPDPRNWKRYLCNPFLQMGVAHIVSIAESTKKAMVVIDNFSERKVKVIHNGIDFRELDVPVDLSAKRRSLGLDEKVKVIGTAARLEEIKNIPMMLRAFKLVLETMPNACLVIAGKGSRERELKAYAELLGMGQKVVFIGLRQDLAEIYHLLDIFLLSSFSEGISLTLLEAMSCSLPAVVTAVGGNREVVVEAETGYLVPVGDDTAMAARILALLRDPALRRRLGERGRERIETSFSFEGMMDSYCRLYRS